jgi:type IV secretory pathway VirB4 component
MPKAPTQEFLEIAEIKEGVVILKDKSLRGVLMISSLNFAVKSKDEQEAILYQFQNFLNSLDFLCQIIVHSQRLNLTGYFDKLKGLEEKQPNELLKLQTKNYREFIQGLVSTGTIMNKNFYVIIPFYPVELKGLIPGKKPVQREAMAEAEFQKAKSQLLQRMEFLILGLRRCGLNAAILNSQEIIELFWSFYHPKEAEMGYYPSIPPELIK